MSQKNKFLLLFVLLAAVEIKSESCDVEIENTLRTLLSPDEYPTMQLQSLRRQLIHKLQVAMERIEEEEDPNLKRSLSALARWNNYPDKRNVEALARAGYIRTLPEEEEEPASDDSNLKRSLANLAKNGQLPHQNAYSKRGIESLARNGELPKRNIGSILRDGKYMGKRTVLPYFYSPNYQIENGVPKRNIGSIKAQYSPKFKRSAAKEALERNKRDVDYYEQDDTVDYPASVYNTFYDYPITEKRFLGRLPQMGKPKSTASPKTRFH